VDNAGRFRYKRAAVLAWFCAGERLRALGPDNAITASAEFSRDSGTVGNGEIDMPRPLQRVPLESGLKLDLNRLAR
jgi:hypothetical protein